MTVVVADTSPLHYLILCEAQEVLPVLFGRVVIPPTVLQELKQPQTPPLVRTWAETLPPWLQVMSPTVLDPSLNVDQGEIEAISLAVEIKATALLIDDRAGRAAARRRGIPITGTIGVLEKAAARGLIELSRVIAKLRTTNARLDHELYDAALRRAELRRGSGSTDGPGQKGQGSQS